MVDFNTIFSRIVDAFMDGPIRTFAQEVLVILVFGGSFILWRRLAKVGKRQPPLAFEEKTAVFAMKSTDAGLRRRTTSNSSRPFGTDETRRTCAMEQTMMRYLDAREFTRALNMYRNVEREGRNLAFSEDLYSSFIQSAIRVGKIDVVERMVRNMKHNGLRPGYEFWQTLLKMLCSRKHFTTVLQLHDNFRNIIPLDKVVLSCLINAALDIGRADKTRCMLESYGKTGLSADEHIIFFRTYQVLGDADAAEDVFHQLGEKVTSLMLNLLLLTCAQTNQPDRARRILREAHVLQTKRDDNILVDVVSFNTVIKGYAQSGQAAQCFEVLTEMRDKGVEPDGITFGTLLDFCIADNQMMVADEIVNVLLVSDKPLDTVMCTLFIKGLVKAGCIERAMNLYCEMRKRTTLHPDVITYSVLMKGLVDHHALDRACGLFRDMREANHEPDDIIYTHLLEGCRHANNHELGMQLYNEMLSRNVRPSEFTLVTMLKLHGRCGFHEEAHDMVATWKEKRGMSPSVIHYTCLMSGCLRTKKYEQAWQAYELMTENGVEADGMTLSTLLPGMVAGQRWERVVQLVEVALSKGSQVVPAESLNNALMQLQSSPEHVHLADAVRNMMKRSGVPLTRRSARANGFSDGRMCGSAGPIARRIKLEQVAATVAA